MLNNQDFALLRTKSLGGSDVGAVLGLSKYRSAVDVWMEKTGKEVAVRDSLPLRFGQFAESFVASEYALATSLSLATHDAAVVHPEYGYMHGHIDRFVLSGDVPLIGSDGQITASRILECKTANPFAQSEWREAGSDQVPLSYLVQCVWYGQMKAANGDFHAHVYGLSLAYQFNTFSARSTRMPFYQPQRY